MFNEPNFSISYPKDGKYDSLIRIAKEYGKICRVYDNFGELRVGIWDKFNS